MLEFSKKNINELEFSLRDKVFNADYLHGDTYEVTSLITNLLFFSDNDNTKNSIQPLLSNSIYPYSQWLDSVYSSGSLLKFKKAKDWVTRSVLGSIKINLYCIFLFNKNYGKTRKIFSMFLSSKNPPEFLDLLLINMFHQVLGLSRVSIQKLISTEFSEIAKHINTLFSDKNNLIENWINGKDKNIFFYSGQTNTILGKYDKIFLKKKTGIAFLNKDADIIYDFGGGFNTSEVERLLDLQIVSADILYSDIKKYDEDLILFKKIKNGTKIVLDDEKTKEYMEKQSKIKNINFDVRKDSFSKDKNSYVIISTDFITTSLNSKDFIFDEKLIFYKKKIVNFYAILRIIELVQSGKDVDFFNVSFNSDKKNKYKTCFIQWRSGKVVKLTTTNFIKNKRKTSSEFVPFLYKHLNFYDDEFVKYLVC